MPWNTVDPIATSALVISGLQTVVSRKANLTASPAVVTIGTINGGTSANIVPETVQMTGTIRAYDEEVRGQIHRDIRVAAEKIAESAGAKAKVSISRMYDTTVNDEALTARMAAGAGASGGRPGGAGRRWPVRPRTSPSSPRRLPACTSSSASPRAIRIPAKAAPNHNPDFFVDERALVVGTRTMASLAVNFLGSEPGRSEPPRRPRPFVQEDR